MNITAALITGATVTVYFTGLVHFRNVDTTNAEVIVPLATETGVVAAGVSLEPHRATIVVEGAGTSCPAGWTYVAATAGSKSSCTLTNVTKQKIELPTTTSTPAFDATTFRVPGLRAVCSGRDLGNLKSTYEEAGTAWAARAQLDRGVLTASRTGDAWYATLTIANAAGSFKVDGKAVTLDPTGSKIFIKNRPIDTSTREHQDESHFFWYYHMYDNAGLCNTLPARTTTGDSHGTDPTHYATSIGCSNTQYP